MPSELGTLVGLAHTLLACTYVCGILMQTLPIPKRDWKAYGPMLMWDSCLGELALGLVGAVQLAVTHLSTLLGTTIPGPFTSPLFSFSLIIAQLVPLNTAIFLLITAVSATVVLNPVAQLLTHMLGPAATWLTGAITLWSMTLIVIEIFPKIWLTLYTLGVCFFAIPFRLGRRVASYLMSSSVVFAIGLPFMPSIALWLEGYIGYHSFYREFETLVAQVHANPLLLPQLITSLPALLGNLMGAVVLALIVFPIVYLFILSAIARSLAQLIGGSSGGPLLTRFIIQH